MSVEPRPIRRLLLATLLGAAALTQARAGNLDALTNADANGGVKAALSQAISTSVSRLGATNGFLGNPKIAIGLPPPLDKAESALRMLGLSGEADELRATMNHAAEAAVATAEPILKNALKSMTLEDAKGILAGPDDAATSYFRRTSSDALKARFRPIVAQQTARLKVGAAYDRVAGKAGELGVLKPEDTSLDGYVTEKALDGLFATMADEERAIRKDPLGQASSLIKKAFGSL